MLDKLIETYDLKYYEPPFISIVVITYILKNENIDVYEDFDLSLLTIPLYEFMEKHLTSKTAESLNLTTIGDVVRCLSFIRYNDMMEGIQ